jgi:FKBP-type peptidyl-prolyl cis-trans isomerase FkpA
MSRTGVIWALIFSIGFLTSCEKPEPYDEEAQYLKDEIEIKNWADGKKIALTKGPSGLYYRIITPGTGSVSPALTDSLIVQYTGRLLTDSVISQAIDETTYKFLLANGIEGWKVGLPLIKEGGTIQLLIPSKMAYRNYDVVTGVPKNAVLNFEIVLQKVIVNK